MRCTPKKHSEVADHVVKAALSELPGSLSTSPAVANLAVALPTISSAIFPLYWSYASEQLGRRVVYLACLTTCVIFSALSAIATSVSMLIVMRVLAAGASTAVTPTGAGVVSDIWEVKEKGQAMSVYYVGILLGPALGPVIGGALVQRWNWRATQWFQTVYAALILILVLFFLPDTTKKPSGPDSVPETLPTRRRQYSWVSFAKRVGSATLYPLRIIKFGRNPAVLLTVYLASITFLIIKAFQVSLQQSFASPPFGFDALIVGLTFIPFAIGLIAGDLFGGKWSDKVMHRTAVAANNLDEKGEIILVPEYRIQENAWLAVLCLPAGLAWYGWSVQYERHWIVPVSFPISR